MSIISRISSIAYCFSKMIHKHSKRSVLITMVAIGIITYLRKNSRIQMNSTNKGTEPDTSPPPPATAKKKKPPDLDSTHEPPPNLLSKIFTDSIVPNPYPDLERALHRNSSPKKLINEFETIPCNDPYTLCYLRNIDLSIFRQEFTTIKLKQLVNVIAEKFPKAKGIVMTTKQKSFMPKNTHYTCGYELTGRPNQHLFSYKNKQKNSIFT